MVIHHCVTLWRFVQCEPEVELIRVTPLHLLQLFSQEDVFLSLRGKKRNSIIQVRKVYYSVENLSYLVQAT